MKNDLKTIVNSSFKIHDDIKGFDKILEDHINGTPEITLSKFLIRSYPMWKSYSKDKWFYFITKIEGEISLLTLASFFGKYLKIDLLKTIDKFDLNINKAYIDYIVDYLVKGNSYLYLYTKFRTPEIDYYLKEEEFSVVRQNLLSEGFVELEGIKPPEDVGV